MKSDANNKLWPFKPRITLLTSALIFICLLLVAILLKTVFKLLVQVPDTSILIGIVFLSLLPIILLLIDTFIDRGGSIEYKGVKINFAQVHQLTTVGFTVPINIGVPGHPVSDSGTTAIIDTLRSATSCNVVIIDLEDGQAWWETRLLVLLAGAARRGRPAKIVFVATDYTISNYFLGWAHANDLLNKLLFAHPQYLRSYHNARAAARQWELVGVVNPPNINDSVSPNPIMPPNIQPGGLAQRHSWMAFNNGLPNEFLPEQLLASELGELIEMRSGPRSITTIRLEELFRPLLHRDHIDLSWPEKGQLDNYFKTDDDFLAVTESGKYKTILSRIAILNALVKEMVTKE